MCAGGAIKAGGCSLAPFSQPERGLRVSLKVRAVVPGELRGPGGDFHSGGAKLTYGWAGPGWPRCWTFPGVGVRAAAGQGISWSFP